MEKEQEQELKDSLRDIIEKNISPSKELCDLAEHIETLSGEGNVNKKTLTLLQNHFMKSLEGALMISNEHHTDLFDYNEWVLAADSFMLSKYDVAAKSLEIRSDMTNRSHDFDVFIVETLNTNPRPAVDILTNADFSDANKKSNGVGFMFEILSNLGEHSEAWVKEEVNYVRDKVDQIADHKVVNMFDENIKKSLENISIVKIANEAKKRRGLNY